MREGFYSVEYSTQLGGGVAVLVFDTGMIVGCDATGSTWDGSYQFNQGTGELDCEITIKMSPHAFSAVSGRQGGGGEIAETYRFPLPRELGAEYRTTIDFAGAFSVNARIRKIREFPS